MQLGGGEPEDTAIDYAQPLEPPVGRYLGELAIELVGILLDSSDEQ